MEGAIRCDRSKGRIGFVRFGTGWEMQLPALASQAAMFFTCELLPMLALYSIRSLVVLSVLQDRDFLQLSKHSTASDVRVPEPGGCTVDRKCCS